MTTSHLLDPVPRAGRIERDYLLKRAADHRRLAERSDTSGARNLHLRFQRLYQNQAECAAMVVPD